MEVTEKNSIKQLLQGFSGDGQTVLLGIVMSVSPLKIQLVNDEKMIIGSNMVYVPMHLKDHSTQVTISGGSVSGATTDGSLLSFSYQGAMTVHNALKAGERVHLLSFGHGKQYYVLDRA